MQYNVEWLFIDYYAPVDCPGGGCSWTSTDEAIQHLLRISSAVNDIRPDIINICEVEGCNELSKLKDELNDTSYNPYLVQGTDTSTGQNVGMLSKIAPIDNELYRSEEKMNYPIPNSSCGSGLPNGSTGLSKHYISKFKINNLNIAFISAHLIAIPTDPHRCSQREAQAQILQNIVYKHVQEGYEIVLLGDFNDYDGSVPDTNSNQPLSSVLEILKGNAGRLNNTYKLQPIARRISQNERYSNWWDSDNQCNTSSKMDYSLIDHILVSNAIDDRIADAFIYHEYGEYCGKMDSDHYPLVIDIDVD
jgi:exonuclease III